MRITENIRKAEGLELIDIPPVNSSNGHSHDEADVGHAHRDVANGSASNGKHHAAESASAS